MLLDLVDDVLILQDGSVVGKVDFLGLLREQGYATASVFVALLEGLEGGHGLTAKTEGLGDFDPVELKGCAAL